jgi:hypothetical protein
MKINFQARFMQVDITNFVCACWEAGILSLPFCASATVLCFSANQAKNQLVEGA